MTTSKGGSLIDRLLGRREGRPGTEEAARLAALNGPREVINDATGFGVQIQPAGLAPGTTVLAGVRVHHLTPQENGGNHHIYMDVYDGAAGPGAVWRAGQRRPPPRDVGRRGAGT